MWLTGKSSGVLEYAPVFYDLADGKEFGVLHTVGLSINEFLAAAKRIPIRSDIILGFSSKGTIDYSDPQHPVVLGLIPEVILKGRLCGFFPNRIFKRFASEGEVTGGVSGYIRLEGRDSPRPNVFGTTDYTGTRELYPFMFVYVLEYWRTTEKDYCELCIHNHTHCSPLLENTYKEWWTRS